MTSGHSVFTHHELHDERHTSLRITLDEYELWVKDFIWDALHGLRYGQSFCNRFGITDNHLYYNTGGIDWADNYIKKTYLARP